MCLEYRMDFRPFLVPDLQQFRREISVRLYIHLVGEFGLHIITGHLAGCS